MLNPKVIGLAILSFFGSALLELESAAGSPALWVLNDDDTQIHILGSVHVLKPGTVWLDESLQQIVLGADGLYLELPPEQQTPEVMQPLVAKYALLPQGDELKNHLPPEIYADLSSELIALGLPEVGFSSFKPWMAVTMYTLLRFNTLGYNPAAGVEATLTSIAQANGTAIDGFETAEFQLQLFDGFSDAEELEMTVQALEDMDQLAEIMEETTSAWVNGDVEALAEIFEESFGENESVLEKMLYARNRNWVGDVRGILEKPGHFLVVVGSAHVVGTNSLIELIEQEGLPVTRVDKK